MTGIQKWGDDCVTAIQKWGDDGVTEYRNGEMMV